MRKVFLIIILLLAFVANVMAITNTTRRSCEGVVAVINPVNVVETASPPDSSLISNNNAIISAIISVTPNSWTLSGESSTLVALHRDQPATVPVSPGEVTVLKLPLTGRQIS